METLIIGGVVLQHPPLRMAIILPQRGKVVSHSDAKSNETDTRFDYK